MSDKDPERQTSLCAPIVYEEDGMLTLHFEIGSVQSQMQINSPDTLLLPYTQSMMAFLLFRPQPRSIGMIGLGGGSMQKYCYRHLPHSRITVAEINPEVIALRDQFYVPNEDHRFQIVCDDGADFVLRHPGEFDVLLVDGFDIDGQSGQICTSHFYDDCYRALTADGVLVVNLCDHRSRILASRIRQSFHDQVIVLDCEGGENKIALAGKGRSFNLHGTEAARTVEYLKHHHALSVNWTTIYDKVKDAGCVRAAADTGSAPEDSDRGSGIA